MSKAKLLSAFMPSQKCHDAAVKANKNRIQTESEKLKRSIAASGKIRSNLHSANISKALAGRSHVGKVALTLKSPEGNKVIASSISSFCREYNLKKANIHKLVNRWKLDSCAQHQGWSIIKLN